MKIEYIRNFDEVDVFQQLIVLQNATDLLQYLKKENKSFPEGVCEKGVEALEKAWSYVDDVLIHGDYE